MQPTPIRTNTTTATPQGCASLFDSLDTIKNEYELLFAELEGVRNERYELEVKCWCATLFCFHVYFPDILN
jgi:hypothetical protein